MSTGESDYAKRVVELSMQLANSRADVENLRMRIKAVDKEHEQLKKDRADMVDSFDAALRRAKAEGVEEGSAQWKKTNAEYERVAKAHSRLSETTDYLIRALEMAQPVVCSMLCLSVKKTGEEWLHAQKCDSISLTLRTAKSMYAGYARAAKIEEGE
jgi:chromosome segregation ATPase